MSCVTEEGVEFQYATRLSDKKSQKPSSNHHSGEAEGVELPYEQYLLSEKKVLALKQTHDQLLDGSRRQRQFVRSSERETKMHQQNMLKYIEQRLKKELSVVNEELMVMAPPASASSSMSKVSTATTASRIKQRIV